MNEKPTIISVSELNQYTRGVLDMHVGKVWVTGEVSNLARPASGHWYFTLKDERAQVRCAMFRNRNALIRTRIDNGMQVVINASASLYENRGEFQLVVDYLEESGIGALQRQFEQLKTKLAEEGLFETRHKQPIPKNLKHIAVVTSKTGAAIHDILKVLNQRFPLLRVTLIPCAVQGEQAAQQICTAIAMAERWNTEQLDGFDAMIVGRGGGSLEDLWPFNEESVARAIFDCKIPIISAVGHEIDVTIADLVADVRAATPSAAAEMISPDREAIAQQLDAFELRLYQSFKQQYSKKLQALMLLQHRLQHPGEKLASYRMRLQYLGAKFLQSHQQVLSEKQYGLSMYRTRLLASRPDRQIAQARTGLAQSTKALQRQIRQYLKNRQQKVAESARLLDMVSPLATLDRGYSITLDSDGKVIRDSASVKKGDRITSRLADGLVHSTVDRTEPTDNN